MLILYDIKMFADDFCRFSSHSSQFMSYYLTHTHTFQHAAFAAYAYKEFLGILNKNVMETI